MFNSRSSTITLIATIVIAFALVILMAHYLVALKEEGEGRTGTVCSTKGNPCKDSRDACQQAHVPLRLMEQAQWLCLPTGQTRTH